jgi:myo-inositol-1(or 4)-monophosphatase
MRKKNLNSPPPLSLISDCAIKAALAAGKILVKHFGKTLHIEEKKGAGLVTNADLESQEKIVALLRKPFPDFGFLTEEAQPEASKSPGRWIIDPLDGTTNYVHGYPMFCISIAAEWQKQTVVGVIYHPILKEMYVAIRGKGSTLNGNRIRVSRTKQIKDSLLSTGFTYRKDDFLHAEMEAFKKLSDVARAVRRPGSAALDLAYTARGVFDGFWERGLSPWDVAAGALLVEEAGGKVTNFKGEPFHIQSEELIACNPILHTPLLQEVAV